MAAGDPGALRTATPADINDETAEVLITRGVTYLTGYQNAAWARHFEAVVRRVQQAELACVGRDPTLPLTKAVARSLMKLMS
jgi:indolepyruvate ferredoxin oxidoreductase